MVKFLIVALGGAIGAVARYSVSLLVTNQKWPAATFIVNVIGSFIIGAFMAWQIKSSNTNNSHVWQLLIATGICGGFTTFSTFSLETVNLLQQQKFTVAILYATVSLIVCVLATFLGLKLLN
jgi:fluoride exporter